jgi:predicted glycoside hydrolase/deacetylase ChbG (UPF0249 family)
MNEPKLRHIWLCADDYGISPAVNAAISDLVSRRRINAVSVMVAAPAFSTDAAAALSHAAAAGGAIGLHVTLTSPFRPLSHGFVPARHGNFLSLAAMLQRSHLRALKPELLTIEVVRQFEAFAAAFGRPPDFVDGHQHVHLLPQVSEAVLRVTKDAAPQAWVRQCGRVGAAHKRFADRKALLLDALSRRFRKLAARYDIRTNPAFAGTYTFRASADYGRLFPDFLESLPEGGVVMCHPGKVDAELRRLDTLTDLREHEYAFFCGAEFPRLLAQRGMRL